jgi:hypothetical protein
LEEVARTINRFANSFDLKDWRSLEEILSEKLDVDYSDLRGERARISRRDYVAQRRASLESLDTHHLIANPEIAVAGDFATCRASGLILRRRGDRTFHSHVIYHFGLQRVSGSWRICSITQKVLWNEGDASIHAGAAPPRRRSG